MVCNALAEKEKELEKAKLELFWVKKNFGAEVERLKKEVKAGCRVMGYPVTIEQLKAGIFIDEYYKVHDITERTPAPPVVWVRQCEPGSTLFRRCKPDGEFIKAGFLLTRNEWSKAIEGIEVRVWEPAPEKPKFRPEGCVTDGDYSVGFDFTDEFISMTTVKRDGDEMEIIDSHTVKKPAKEPEVWEYAVWKDSVGHFCPEYKGNPCLDFIEPPFKIEETIRKLTGARYNFKWHGIDRSLPPAFGVRKLRGRDRGVEYVDSGRHFGAFRDGKYIRGSIEPTALRCVNWTINSLTPAPPARTLADLEVIP